MSAMSINSNNKPHFIVAFKRKLIGRIIPARAIVVAIAKTTQKAKATQKVIATQIAVAIQKATAE